MKAVSGKTWVQKAVFLEPKPLFSSAFTMCSRGWYLCMELRMIWAWGEGEDISWEWRGARCRAAPSPQTGRGKREGPADTPKKVFFLLKSFSSSSSPLSMDITCAGGISPQKSSPPTAKRAHQGLSFLAPFIPRKQHPSVATGQVGSLPAALPAAPGCAAVFPPPETLIHVSTASGGLFLPPQPPPQQHRHLSPPPQ